MRTSPLSNTKLDVITLRFVQKLAYSDVNRHVLHILRLTDVYHIFARQSQSYCKTSTQSWKTAVAVC